MLGRLGALISTAFAPKFCVQFFNLNSHQFQSIQCRILFFFQPLTLGMPACQDTYNHTISKFRQNRKFLLWLVGASKLILYRDTPTWGASFGCIAG